MTFGFDNINQFYFQNSSRISQLGVIRISDFLYTKVLDWKQGAISVLGFIFEALKS